jgi:hypothetical protein
MEDDIIWTEALSSRVNKVGYSPTGQALYVEWSKGGKTSRYANVPPDVADSFAKSWSVGEAVNTMLTGKYEMQYV